MKSLLNFLIISTSCFVVANRNQGVFKKRFNSAFSNEDSGEAQQYKDPKFQGSIISLRGELRRSFALRAALDKQNQNMVCSPLSALMPLGKLAIGARDDALSQLLRAIGLSRRRKLKPHFKPLIEGLAYLPGAKLSVASSIYFAKHRDLSQLFMDQAIHIFGSSAEKVDFSRPKNAAEQINSWVKKKTDGMIRRLISPSEISSDTSLALVNAIYFAGRWKEPFDKVKEGTFYSPGGERRTPMMTKHTWFKYYRSINFDAQLIEVPYAGDAASFIIILPSKRNGLPALLSQLKVASDLLIHELRKMRKLKVMLTMPKFRIETELDLKDLYKKIGVTNIFKTNGNSGLDGILRGESVAVSSAKQKAIIEVTEFGTEAAASSVLQVTKLIHQPSVKFLADHPFLFYIIAQGQQLFAGTFVIPG